MASFFVLHGGIVLVEARFKIKSRLFAIAAFLVTLPLFAETLMRALGL